MNSEEEEWVKQTLECEKRGLASKVLAITCKNAAGDGDNYSSEVFRLNLKLLTLTGKIVEKSLLYKTLPRTDGKFADAANMGVFHIEIYMYKEVFKQMETLLQVNEPGSEIMWPQFYYSKENDDGYLMEDLLESGFKMMDRGCELDFNHCALVMKALAKLHATGSHLLESGAIKEEKLFSANFHFRSEEAANQMILMSTQLFPNVIEKYWPTEWHEYITGLRNLRSKLIPVVTKNFEVTDYSFIGLNHGDCWLNNIMFKYDSEGVPTSLRFVDFQICYKHSPCFDLQYLFTTSVKLEVTERKLDLLKIYHENLVRYLKLFEYPKKIITFEDLLKDFEKTKPYGFAVSLNLKPFHMNPPLKELCKKYNVDESNIVEKYSLLYRSEDEYFRRTIRKALVEMKEYGLL